MTTDAGVLLVGAAAILSFVAAFHWSGLIVKSRVALQTAARAKSVVFEKSMTDDEKQRLVQGLAINLFAHFGIITLTMALMILSPGLVIWLSDVIGLAPSKSVLAFLMDWRVILLSTAFILAGVWTVRQF